MTEIFRKLPVTLTAGEKALRGEEMAREVSRHAALEVQKKDETKRLGELIKDSDERIAELALQVNTGIEHREVRCVELPRHARNVVEIQRADTGEIVDSRPMRADERQVGMPFDDDDETDSSNGPTH
ncbi:MAG TPA: hypothetical protein VFX59_03310 [Polyangiales bacterium]|nr:hypothetical protein [Polyangiales bacterium]